MSALMKFGNTIDFHPGRVHTTDTEAIRDLQQYLGLEPCFRTAKLLDCATECQWRQHCRKPVAEWRREW